MDLPHLEDGVPASRLPRTRGDGPGRPSREAKPGRAIREVAIPRDPGRNSLTHVSPLAWEHIQPDRRIPVAGYQPTLTRAATQAVPLPRRPQPFDPAYRPAHQVENNLGFSIHFPSARASNASTPERSAHCSLAILSPARLGRWIFTRVKYVPPVLSNKYDDIPFGLHPKVGMSSYSLPWAVLP